MPAGFVTIVKSVRLFNASGAARTVHVEVATPPAGGIEISRQVFGAAAVLLIDAEDFVMTAGQELKLWSSGIQVYVLVSGSELAV